VHNTPSGIFSVATKNLAPSTSLAGHASLFADAMLEGMLAVLTLGVPVVVSVADEALPQIFRGSAPSPFPSHAYAVVLGPRPSTHLRGGPPPDLRPEPGDSPTFHTVPTLAALNAICTFAHALGGRKKSRVSGLGGGFDLLLQHADDGPSLHLVAANAAEGGTAASHEGNHAH
jgi:hypothetical protein